jgi:putative endopeptidase
MSENTPSTLPSGLLTDEFDPGIRPQDDLFRHVNGRWIERTEIPADRARYGSFYLLAEKAEEAVRDIIIEAQDAEPGTEERKIGDLYASFLDEDAVEARGAQPLAPLLEQVSAVEDIDGLLGTLGRLERTGIGGLLRLFIDNDPGKPERYLVFLEQGGLGLPDESYYREDSSADIRAAYLAHLERVLALAEWPEPKLAAERIFALETEIAATHWDNVRTRDSEATYNLREWADVSSAVGVDLQPWLSGLGAPESAFSEVVVREPSFLEGVGPLLVADRVPAWRDWLAWHAIRGLSAYLSSEFVNANFDFYGKTLTGTPELRARWKRGVSLVEGALGEAVGHSYVERHFPPTAKTEMDILVARLIEAYRDSIASLEWMSEETRGRALDKLEKFVPKIGYPDSWRDYSALAIDPTDLLGNVRRANEFEFARELAKIGAPLDRGEWFMTPQTVNAYYNPGFNEIVFPAAILQYPFFVEGRDAAANYGAIGAVIGHEIGHGFDDQGSRFDGDGRLTDWWTPADREAFEQRTASLIAQYDELVPEGASGQHVNGALTIGENIGDLGGLGIAWKAYLLSLGGEEPPVIDGLTGAQRFLLSWAQAWQLKSRSEEVVRLLTIDPHSPNEFRCNQIVRNLDVFYEAFAVTESDALWLPEETRVTIW